MSTYRMEVDGEDEPRLNLGYTPHLLNSNAIQFLMKEYVERHANDPKAPEAREHTYVERPVCRWSVTKKGEFVVPTGRAYHAKVIVYGEHAVFDDAANQWRRPTENFEHELRYASLAHLMDDVEHWNDHGGRPLRNDRGDGDVRLVTTPEEVLQSVKLLANNDRRSLQRVYVTV